MIALSRSMLSPLAPANLARGFSTGHSEKWSSAADMGIAGGENAYEVLGVPPTCSEETIKKAFKELAKATHPDMQTSHSHRPSSARFIVVVSAYQILSNPQKRAQYDAYLQRCVQSCEKPNNPGTKSASCRQGLVTQEMEIAKWARWYVEMVTGAVNHHEIGIHTGSMEDLRRDVQEALKKAYFGPCVEIDALPDCFEAEERAGATESDLLHLVSGRNLFGVVREVSGMELLGEGIPKHVPLAKTSGNSQCNQSPSPGFLNNADTSSEDYDHRGFVDLELYLFGNLVARASRKPCKAPDVSISQAGRMDEISVYLCCDELSSSPNYVRKSELRQGFQGMLLGKIIGLDTTDFGGKGKVYSPDGQQTHVVCQYRTPWVRHMHWFKVDDKGMLCECKSTRARLPSSKFWMFEPRCKKHNIGGWYIETLWRNASTHSACMHRLEDTLTNENSADFLKRGPSDWAGRRLGLLHPAMYIFGAAYRTLDAETTKRQKRSLMSKILVQPTLHAAASRALQWCKGRLSLVKH